MEIIKNILRKRHAKKTGRTCARCANNCGGKCMRPYDQYMACWHSITRPGFMSKAKVEAWRSKHIEAKPAADLHIPTPAPLTPEQVHQMAMIKATLEEAGKTAKDGGLLGEE